MKKYFNQFMYSGLMLLVMMFTSCQEEFEPLPDGNEQETIKADSSTAQLIKKTSSNDGSFDNIVDGASCFAINFPYVVEIEGIAITIDSLEDLNTIERIFDEIDGDEDILDIVFPITITLADFTEVVINGLADLRALASECIEGGGDDDIECIDFVYPISFFTFDASFNQTGAVTIENDMQLRRFFAGLGASDIISVDFPLTLDLHDGSSITVNTNEELANAIDAAKEACDEDDDNDFNDDDFTEVDLEAYLMECSWFLQTISRMDIDRTTLYKNFEFTFKEDGIVTVYNKVGELLNGTWSSNIDEDGAKITLFFNQLEDFNLEWSVYEIDTQKIKLFNEKSNKIILKQDCNDNSEVSCSDAFISDVISSCKWVITDENGEFFEELEIDFSNFNIHVFNTNDEVVEEGNWEIAGINIKFNNLNMALANYIGTWEVVECSNRRFKLKKESEFIVLTRNCG